MLDGIFHGSSREGIVER
jgi:hypothetical protein